MTKDEAPLVMGAKADNPVNVAQGLAATAAKAARGGPAPVHLWNPPYCGDLDIEIRADGRWFSDGTEITRPALVRLFASILKREGDRHFLVTPVEKVGIRVVDAPFVAIDAEIGEDIVFTTNLGETVTAGPDNAIEIRGTPEAPRPYLHVRRGLYALIDRKTFYRLAEAARSDADGRLILQSGGTIFPLEG